MKPSNVRRLPPGRPAARQEPPRIEDLQTVLRVLVGGALEGTDELLRRLKVAQAELESAEIATTLDPSETELDRLRYALIGTLLQTPTLVQEGVATAGRVSSRAANFIARLTAPVASSRVVRPVRRRYEGIVARGEARVGRLLERGRAEERAGRALARRATANSLAELLDYLAQKPEIRALVQQQSLGMADEAMAEIRNRSAAADALAERLARAILRRPPRESLPPEAGHPERR